MQQTLQNHSNQAKLIAMWYLGMINEAIKKQGILRHFHRVLFCKIYVHPFQGSMYFILNQGPEYQEHQVPVLIEDCLFRFCYWHYKDEMVSQPSIKWSQKWYQGLYSLRRRRLMGIGIPMINLRRSDDRLRFIMGIPILIRRHLLSE